MTWIVGRATMFGYAAGISDVRVTLGDDSELDCLQKIHPVGKFMALGFAGSVAIGFDMVEHLTELLRRDEPDMTWDPHEVAEWWPEDAKQVFDKASSICQDQGCHLMLLSAHPTENAGDAPWARCYVHRFRAPGFVAEECQGSEVVSIGSGSGEDPYLQVLRDVGADPTNLMLEAGGPGGAGSGLAMAVALTVDRNPVPTVSPYVQTCLVRRGAISIGPVVKRVADPGPPTLACNRNELEALLRGTGATAEQARC